MDDGSRSGFFSRLFKRKDEETVENEIVSILNEGQDQGIIQKNEADMISNIFELDDIEASQIMTHRKNISAVDSRTTLEKTIQLICEENFSRFPVFNGNIDTICGILHIKDAVRAFLTEDNRKRPVEELEGLLQKPLFVPETSKIDKVFKNMQAEATHMAVVVDEYGQTAGIITMEDILEEIVGNIFDEHDEVEYNITRLSSTAFDIKGLTPLAEIEEVCGITIDDEDNDTLNGYLISKLDRIPDDDVGTVINTENIKFVIQKVEDKTIALVRMIVKEQSENKES